MRVARDGDAHADGQRQLVAVDALRTRHLGPDALRDLERGVEVAHRVQQHGELVAAESRDQVGRPEQRRERVRDGDEHVVAHLVTETVVDLLEPVDVDEEHRDAATRRGDVGPGSIEALEEQPAVGHVRERVVLRVVHELHVHAAARADVPHVAHEPFHRRVVDQVREVHLHPLRAAVGPADRHLGDLELTRSRLQLAEQPLDGFGVVGVDPVDVETGELLGRATEEVPHRGAGVLHRAAVLDDEDRVGGVLHERAEAVLALALLPLGELLVRLAREAAKITVAVTAPSSTARPWPLGSEIIDGNTWNVTASPPGGRSWWERGWTIAVRP